MFLQSLELVGFKSFASRTILEFHRGVTAVVGPNGCGKSNVLDAIRWVLGEQSAKALRGGEMADVIFSGTDSRKSLGMAEVSMTFADCEKELGVAWNEVKITRRVFRDGKSEYLINKAPSRLRDIHELFMDTGIGRSAYSIMEQGKLDQILSSRPDDRRAIFEEAAGITKYKSQKKEALRKLEHTDANLLRVADIIHEVKRQIGSLQRQANKARRYQSLAENLRIFDTHLTHRNYAAFHQEVTALRNDLLQLEEDREANESLASTKEGEMLSYRVQLGGVDTQISEVKDQCQQVQNRIHSAEHRIDAHKQRLEELESLIARNEQDIAGAEEKRQAQVAQIEQTKIMIAELLGALATNEDSLHAYDASAKALRHTRLEAERSLTELSTALSGIEVKMSLLRGEKASMEGRREAGESRIAGLHGEVSTSSESLHALENRYQEAAQHIRSLEISLATTNAQLTSYTEELAVLKSEHSAVLEGHRRIERKAAELQSKLQVLEEFEAVGEGLGAGTQALLAGLDSPDLITPNILGAIATLIDIDIQYIPAMEAILENDLQAVLFQEATSVELAARQLAQGDYGRSYLLLKNDLCPDTNMASPAIPEGGIAWAKDCLRGDNTVCATLWHRLAGVLIVSDLTTAFHLHSRDAGITFVTLAGEVVGSNGMIAAGKMGGGLATALLRKQEIAVLKAEITCVLEECETLWQQANDLTNQIAISDAELSHTREFQHTLQVELSTGKNEQSLLERQRHDTMQRHDSLARELDALQVSLEECSTKLAIHEEQIHYLQKQQEEVLAQRAKQEAEVLSLREQETEQGDSLNELRIRVATERQQRENWERQLEPMSARLQELAELQTHRGTDIATYRERMEGLQGEISSLQGNRISWEEELSRLQNEGASMLAQRAELLGILEALENALRNAQKSRTEIQETRSKLEIKITQIELRQQNLREHITRRYQIDLEEFAPDTYGLYKALKEQEITLLTEDSLSLDAPPNTPVRDKIPWEQVETIVAELTERLDSMGPVNLEAIQEFEELEARYHFLEKQNADLTNAKTELLAVIARINKTTKEMFSDTFEKIRINFQEMFTELFGGGKANLVMINENDPLESGIEIIAKPPGKQLQSITLLSGGERTMTAVSLLFAIYMVKPSPFCVLDEMDAPLDESNIRRFIKILDRFIGQSQFIVITHNKRTMSRADMLYGVTMQEHGVSKLVGVKFHDTPTSSPSTETTPTQLTENPERLET